MANLLRNCFMISLFILPGIKMANSIPSIRPEDFVIYFMTLYLLVLIKHSLIKPSQNVKTYLLVILLFMIWIFITLVGNNRLTIISDYFEFFKLIKYMIVFYFFYMISAYSKESDHGSSSTIRRIFYFLLVFNVMNYTDLFNFNSWMIPHYFSSEYKLDLDRVIGTMGNPNNNAIVMAYFVVFFLIEMTKSKRDFVLFMVSLVLLLISESRTAFIGLGIVFFINWISSKISFIKLVSYLVLVFAVFHLVTVFNLDYISSLWNIELQDNTSWTQRLEVWSFLMNMVNKSPWIGYGPNKEFFYANSLYADNEYILMMWRYGFIGLSLYMMITLIPVITAIKYRMHASSKVVLLFSSVILISAITNAPIAEPRIMVLYAMLCGVMYADCNMRDPLIDSSLRQQSIKTGVSV